MNNEQTTFIDFEVKGKNYGIQFSSENVIESNKLTLVSFYDGSNYDYLEEKATLETKDKKFVSVDFLKQEISKLIAEGYIVTENVLDLIDSLSKN